MNKLSKKKGKKECCEYHGSGKCGRYFGRNFMGYCCMKCPNRCNEAKPKKDKKIEEVNFGRFHGGLEKDWINYVLELARATNELVDYANKHK